ncbi:erythromycin esterase family protein [Legionella yabuuchiae]|uniref:erythromycin esterase family protein n=1 Tax=Legionella yabuuchiae TaxID=376727 RepID=UPI001056C76B|nr:erythromycin esterase family protein [Legionella yabuuchiae]
MTKEVYDKLVHILNEAAIPISHQKNYEAILDDIGDARFVLMGEATHGTEEFYQTRIELTKLLIEQKGFMAVAIEGDWPDSYRINRYIMGLDGDDTAHEALQDFQRFPTWMWRNTTMPPFLSWIRNYNDNLSSPEKKVGFYGLDLYSLNASMEAVIRYLKNNDPEAAERAIKRYNCFNHLGVDPQAYGYLVNAGIKKACVKEVLDQLVELQHHAHQYLENDGLNVQEEYFMAAQNARLVKDAERYYRTMFEERVSSWNVRDRHMADMVNVLADHLEKRFGTPSKLIIWAHNSHVGDARATEMGERGEWNIGQLIREEHDSSAYIIGFSTYEGTVAAASSWDAPVERKKIVPGMEGSYEALFHDLKYDQFFLKLIDNEEIEHYLKIPRLERAIGVIYRPETERMSHYFLTQLPYQFDGIIHFDRSTAVTPLDVNQKWV